MNIISSGIGITTGDVDLGKMVSCLKVHASAADATVTVNKQTFKLYQDEEYLTLPVDTNTFTVASGVVDYIALG